MRSSFDSKLEMSLPRGRGQSCVTATCARARLTEAPGACTRYAARDAAVCCLWPQAAGLAARAAPRGARRCGRSSGRARRRAAGPAGTWRAAANAVRVKNLPCGQGRNLPRGQGRQTCRNLPACAGRELQEPAARQRRGAATCLAAPPPWALPGRQPHALPGQHGLLRTTASLPGRTGSGSGRPPLRPSRPRAGRPAGGRTAPAPCRAGRACRCGGSRRTAPSTPRSPASLSGPRGGTRR